MLGAKLRWNARSRLSIAVTALAVSWILSEHNSALAIPCKAAEPQLLVYNRLPWFKSTEWEAITKNQSALHGWERMVTAMEKDAYTSKTAIQFGDVRFAASGVSAPLRHG